MSSTIRLTTGSLALVAAAVLATIPAKAQDTNTPAAAPTAPGSAAVTPMPGAPTPGANPTTSTVAPDANVTPAPGPVDRNTGAAAAGGDNNQAVATTNANAAQPASGANSFTMGEAKSRISSRGFQSVSDLKQDNDGVWRGTATKDGQQVGVWLDYKGNVGQQ